MSQPAESTTVSDDAALAKRIAVSDDAALAKRIAVSDDAALAKRIAQRDPAILQDVMHRNGQRLFRTAFAILGTEAEAEDVVQTTYLKAFAAIETFAGRSSLSTWLTRIAINEALGRVRAANRRRSRLDPESTEDLGHYREKLMRGSLDQGADVALARKEIRQLTESAIAKLPRTFRTVFVMREIEDMSIAEIAEMLGIVPATVKTRLLRARRRLQQALAPDLHAALADAFPFAGERCAALRERVMRALCDPATSR